MSIALAAGAAMAEAACVLPPPAPPPTPVLAMVPYPYRIAVDDTNVYVSQQAPQPLLAVSKEDGTVSPVGVQSAGAVAVDDQDLYWTDGSGVFFCDKSNCAGTTTSLAAEAASDIALDLDNVYWSTSNATGPGHIMKAPKGGGAPVLIADMGSPGGLAVDTHDVYWIDANVVKTPIVQGVSAPALVDSRPDASALALDADHVYVRTTGGKLFKVSKNGASDGETTLLTDLGTYSGPVATDGTTVYAASDHNVVNMPVSGGRVMVMTPGLDLPSAIVLDATNVYVADVAGGVIAKFPK